MIEVDQDIQIKAAQLEYLNQQIKAFQMQLMELEKSMEELSILKVGLKNLDGSQKGDDVLVPLGASVYAHGTLRGSKEVMVNIGAGVFVNKNIEDAVPLVDQQIKQVSQQEEVLAENITLLNREAEKLTRDINQALVAMQNAGLPA